jgi:uncharacterized protein YqeY
MSETGTSQLKSTLRADLHGSMRDHDKVRSETLRMALTAITNEEVSGTEARELSDDEVLKVVAKEEAELVILEAYLPAQLSDAELEALVAQALDETGATGMAQMGQVMKVASALVAGRADGGRVAAIVKSSLAPK